MNNSQDYELATQEITLLELSVVYRRALNSCGPQVVNELLSTINKSEQTQILQPRIQIMVN